MSPDKIAKFTKIISFRFNCTNIKIIIMQYNQIKRISYSTVSAIQRAKSSGKNNGSTQEL